MDNDRNIPGSDENFSDNEEENLRIENEILRMKINAELGGMYESTADMPPALENEFLKNILAFEHKYATANHVKVHELIGNPAYKQAAELDDPSLSAALKEIEKLLEKRKIEVEFLRPRDDRFRYQFITEELFEVVTDDMEMEGMTKHFTYEEFHPDHEMEIREKAEALFSGWFHQTIDGIGLNLAESFIQPDGRILPRTELYKRLEHVFEAYQHFEDGKIEIDSVSYSLNEDPQALQQGLGYAEGKLSYRATLENNETQHVNGGFKFYFSREADEWCCFFFYLPGFNV